MDIHWVIARRKHLALQASRDAQFSESDHPRAPDGKFGSGGGGVKQPTEPVSVKVASRPPFVSKFVEEHRTIAGQKQYLSTLPSDKLHKALKLSEGHIDPASTHVRGLIEKELDERASSGK